MIKKKKKNERQKVNEIRLDCGYGTVHVLQCHVIALFLFLTSSTYINVLHVIHLYLSIDESNNVVFLHRPRRLTTLNFFLLRLSSLFFLIRNR